LLTLEPIRQLLNAFSYLQASFRIPVRNLGYKCHTGRSVALGIVEAYEMAQIDPYRATTHNKGIMNGIDAVALATGQDWRAIEAGAHAWAACGDEKSTTRYEPLTTYWIEKEEIIGDNNQMDNAELYLCGELRVPICVGTAGGVVGTNPVYRYNLGLMRNPSSSELAKVSMANVNVLVIRRNLMHMMIFSLWYFLIYILQAMACVGLAQNFAALRALTTEGIQRGHMKLHAKNIVMAAGCPSHAITTVTDKMVDTGQISLAAAKNFIDATVKKGIDLIKNGDSDVGSVTSPLECAPMWSVCSRDALRNRNKDTIHNNNDNVIIYLRG
jgi:hydroxymethylglutaryl-CoA reductase